MTYSVTLPIFQGPLDLLLQLIRQHKLEISEVSLLAVTSQYLEILHLMESLDLEVAGEFIVIAATLMEIKSRSLLPPPETPDDADEEGLDPEEELIRRLQEYEQFRKLADRLGEMAQEAQLSLAREAVEGHVGAVPLEELTLDDLIRSLRRMFVEETDPRGGRRLRVARQAINLRQRLIDVWRRLRERDGPTPFSELVPRDSRFPRRQEVLVTFLAVLELMRAGMATAWQAGAAGEITVGARPDAPASLPRELIPIYRE